MVLIIDGAPSCQSGEGPCDVGQAGCLDVLHLAAAGSSSPTLRLQLAQCRPHLYTVGAKVGMMYVYIGVYLYIYVYAY